MWTHEQAAAAAHVKNLPKQTIWHKMDIIEVPVSQTDSKGKKKKNKKAKKKSVENAEGSSVEKKEEKMEKSEGAEAAFPPTFSVSEIKNKQRRHLMFMKLKQEKRKVNANKYLYI